MGQGSHHEWDQ
ncbi:hypothetical protein CGCSCA4_v008281 [Colletotrichum siamense]|uniref:Uncharacterized protein n=1 Tax=Colletotrichum siamense TaxID=690259 RepID=A0A9P5K3D2_COLSI|nr:hypothetical protein CGCSCA4_v008281 [Colletotrichum siamense]KAF4856438.1 hypothetical protein CGCSCA2_v008601 [Colletotrichum siamense]KAF4880599.1 hypothetical protein CGCSCA1_v000129 [Colletotrichum siamense]